MKHWVSAYNTRRGYTVERRVTSAWRAFRHVLYAGRMKCHIYQEEDMKHTKTDPVCIHFKETWPFLRYLNERARGKACLICVPAWPANPSSAYHEQITRDANELAAAYIKATSPDGDSQ